MKMVMERRLLAEAEDKKHKIMQEILEKDLAALKEENMRKEEELREIEKRKISTLDEILELEKKLVQSVSFYFYIVFFYIFTSVYIHRDVIFIYIYML